MKLIFLTIILSVLLFTQASTFKYYVFASEWPGSICATQNCNQDQGIATNFWNIHGLWPSDGSDGPNFCNSDDQYDSSDLSDLATELDKYWNGLYSSAEAFHSHEWMKHGTCANMPLEKFFSTVIEVAEKVDIYNALANSGIVPGGTYQCEAIAAALTKQFNVDSFTVQSSGQYLSSIELCVDLDLNVINCPSDSSDDSDDSKPTTNSTNVVVNKSAKNSTLNVSKDDSSDTDTDSSDDDDKPTNTTKTSTSTTKITPESTNTSTSSSGSKDDSSDGDITDDSDNFFLSTSKGDNSDSSDSSDDSSSSKGSKGNICSGSVEYPIFSGSS